MAASGQVADMPFIVTDGRGKAEPSKRLLIRRHVMLGKNRGKTRKVPAGSTAGGTAGSTTGSTPDRSADGTVLSPQHSGQVASLDGDGRPDPDVSISMRYAGIPSKVGFEFSLTRFAVAVEQPLLRDLLHFCFMSKRIMYPLEQCIRFYPDTKVDASWLELLTSDDAYMHAAIFSSQAYNLSTSGDHNDPAAAQLVIAHQSAALRLLRERLSLTDNKDNKDSKDSRGAISDATVIVVLYLTLHAHFQADSAVTAHHMAGLRKIVELRGGLAAFRHNTKLIIEMLKCDLGIALSSGSRPLFADDPMLASITSPAPTAPPLDEPDELGHGGMKATSWKPTELNLSPDLLRIWMRMDRFCAAVNAAARRKRRLPKERLLDAMASTLVPLLSNHSSRSSSTPRPDDPTASADEVVRLGLLAFSSHIFLSWKGLRPARDRFPQAYRRCLLEMACPSLLPPRVLLWLLAVGALSVFTEADHVWLVPWLSANVRLCGVRSWSELRRQLKELLWIDVLHDKPGRELYTASELWQKEGAIA